jgi:hypothetical protein
MAGTSGRSRLGNRRLLPRAGDTLSPRALARLQATPGTDDPTDEIGSAWGVREQLRQRLTAGCLAEGQENRMLLGWFVLDARMHETDRLWATVTAWWPATTAPVSSRQRRPDGSVNIHFSARPHAQVRRADKTPWVRWVILPVRTAGFTDQESAEPGGVPPDGRDFVCGLHAWPRLHLVAVFIRGASQSIRPAATRRSMTNGEKKGGT